MNLGLNRKDILRYTLLPQLGPRVMSLFGSGFTYIPFFMALVYGTVRLLPSNHPYLNPENIGRFGIRHVIAEAANHLNLSRKNFDQIVVFGLILLGLALLFIQFAFLIMAMMVPVASAAGVTELFASYDRSQDIAFIMLDLVFGVEGMFNSCVADTARACLDFNGNNVSIPGSYVIDERAGQTAPVSFDMTWPYPIHGALHNLFAIYTQGLLIVAIIITLYFVTTILVETAQTGTPFGKRYNKVWAPLRILLAFALLVPLGGTSEIPGEENSGASGLNASQYIVLTAAKYGSLFASNGWVAFNMELNASYKDAFGRGTRYVSTPEIPEIGTLLQFMFTAKTCAYAVQQEKYGKSLDEELVVRPYLVRPGILDNRFELKNPKLMRFNDFDAIDQATPYDEMVAFAGGNNTVILRFGVEEPPQTVINEDGEEEDNTKFGRYLGGIKPECGELTIRLADPRPSRYARQQYKAFSHSIDDPDQRLSDPGPEILQRYYWYVTKEMWWTDAMFGWAEFDAKTSYPKQFVQRYGQAGEIDDFNFLEKPQNRDGQDYRTYLQQFYSDELRFSILGSFTFPQIKGAEGNPVYTQGAVIGQEAADFWNYGLSNPELLRNPDNTVAFSRSIASKGWGGAAVFYDGLASKGDAVTQATRNTPFPSRQPDAMDYVRESKRQFTQNISPDEQFSLNINDAVALNKFPGGVRDEAVYYPSFAAHDYWQKGNLVATTHSEPTGNIIIDYINALLGTDGLYNMRQNADVHPLAQLVGIGRSLVDSSIANLGYATAGGVGGFIGSFFNSKIGAAASTGAGFLITIAMIGLTAGFVLFYIVPFLPFIYFFFAVGGWVKGIFEAMVGAPLWALAHIRIDGNGLPGQASVNGYFLLFEIFLRPILVIFGFLASISIFSATVYILNDIFDVVTANVAGHDVSETVGDEGLSIDLLRGPIDEFFYTVIYAIIVYMMGMASFKLIDLVPNQILRWMGQSVTTFGDQKEDPTQRLTGTATIGSQQFLSSLGNGFKSFTGLAAGDRTPKG